MKKFYLVFIAIAIIKCASVPIRTDIPETIIPYNSNAINVADLTFDISPRSQKEFFYQFDTQDTIILNTWAIKGKDISEIRIIKWPNTPVFNTSAKQQIENKKMFVNRKSVFQFVFSNTGIWTSKTYRLVLFSIISNTIF